jgi:hypothetical protein
LRSARWKARAPRASQPAASVTSHTRAVATDAEAVAVEENRASGGDGVRKIGEAGRRSAIQPGMS